MVQVGDELVQPLLVAGDVDERLQDVGALIGRLALQAAREHVFPGGHVAAAPFADHLGVVDLPQLHVPSAHRAPQPGEAALAPDRFRRAREQQQEASPGVGVASRMHRHLAHEAIVEQGRELTDRLIDPRRCASVEQQRVGQDGQPERGREDVVGRLVRDVRQRGGDGGVGRRVQRHRARRGFAGAGEVVQSRRLFGRKRARFGHLSTA